MGKTKVNVPAPSAEEKALQQAQADLLNQQSQILQQQQEQQKILLPFLAEQNGFKVELDDNGNLIGISKIANETDELKQTLDKELTERSLAALRGELPVSPALEQDLAKQEQTLRERLSKQLGTGYETSSAGIETLAQFNSKAEALREGARAAQLSLSEQLGIAREQENNFIRQQGLDSVRQGTLGDQLTLAGAFGQVAAGYGQAQGPYLAQRQLQTQANAANASLFGDTIGALIGAGGKIGAAYFSDERLKTNSVTIGRMPNGIPIRVYDYDGERRIGVFASDVEDVLPHAVGERYGYKTVNYEAL